MGLSERRYKFGLGETIMRILLIEDDLTIAEFIENGLHQAGFVVDLAHDGRLGLDLALGREYDLGIIDIMLPKLDGLSIIQKLREKQIALPIIVLSAKRSVDDRIIGLERGGDDYLVKPFSFSELLARVHALIRRTAGNINQTDATTLCVADLTIDLLSRTAQRGAKKINLQPKEFALLEYLIRNENRIVSKTMIMERVWNYSFDPHTNVVEARVSKLREKVDKGFNCPLIHTVRGLGYILKNET